MCMRERFEETEQEEHPTGSIPKLVTEARNPSHVDIIEGGSRVTDTFGAKIILSYTYNGNTMDLLRPCFAKPLQSRRALALIVTSPL